MSSDRGAAARLPLGEDPVCPRPVSVASSISVAHVLDTEGYAGRESVVESLAAAQKAAGIDVRVLAVVEKGNGRPPFLDAARNSGIPLVVVRLQPRAYLEERRRLVGLLRKFDVVHTHGYRPDVIGGSAASKLGLPKVSTVHGFIGGGWKNRCFEHIQRWSLRRYDSVIAVSRVVAADLIESGVPESKVHVIQNAWARGDEDFFERSEARRQLGIDDGRYLIGWVGRLNRVKGPDVLLRALRHAQTDDVTVSMIGDGPEHGQLLQEAKHSASGAHIKWHGSIRDAYRLFPAFDVFVLSSRSEGTPMVLLEAMAAKVPIVATEVGGVPDVISKDEGRLVPSEDPDALWRAMADVRNNPAEASRRTRAATKRLERDFGVDRWVARYGHVYRSVVNVQARS